MLSLIWASTAFAHSNELVACIDDHPPYQILAEKPYGSHITALEVLANVLNKQLKFIESPNFARCVAMLKQGRADVVAGLGPTPERNKFAFYTPFKISDPLVVISKKGITINTYDDFRGKIIGIARGTSYFPRFDKDNELNKISMQSVRIGFSLLLKDRIDLFMLSPANFDTFSKDITDANLKVSPINLKELRDKETAFGFSKAHKLDLTNDEIAEKVRTAYQTGRFK